MPDSGGGPLGTCANGAVGGGGVGASGVGVGSGGSVWVGGAGGSVGGAGGSVGGAGNAAAVAEGGSIPPDPVAGNADAVGAWTGLVVGSWPYAGDGDEVVGFVCSVAIQPVSAGTQKTMIKTRMDKYRLLTCIELCLTL